MENLNYKKYFLTTLVVALSISALIGIIIFLFSDFGEIEIQLLLTTLSIGGYSLTGLCSSIIYNREDLKAFSIYGMLISIVGFITTILGIWEILDFGNLWKIIAIFIILSVGTAHASLIMLIKTNIEKVKLLMTVTISFISVICLMLIYSTINEFSETEFYYRMLGVIGILIVLGTIVTPILNKMDLKNDKKTVSN